MKILAADTSSSVCSVAIWDEGRIVSEINIDYKLTHSETLMPLVDACLDYVHLDVKEIDVFAVSVGPGSFTGVRIGVCSVKAMAQALSKPIAAVDTLEALAQNVCGFEGIVCPIIDARRGQVYYAGFQKDRRIWEDTAGHIDQVIDQLKGRKTMFVGDGAVILREYIKSKMDGAQFAEASLTYQRAAAVAEAAARQAVQKALLSPEEVTPNYIRESGAVRKKMEK